MSLSSSTSIHPTTAASNRSTLSRESILEARQRRRRRIQTQKHSQVQHHHTEGQRNTAIPKTPFATNLPSTSGSTVRSLRTRFLDTSSIRGMTMNSMDNILDDGNSYILVSEDDDDNDNNKSTQSMIDKEIDAFILPLDYSKTYCHTTMNDEYEYDPYLVPISMIRKKQTEQYHYIENDELVTASKYVPNDKQKKNQTEVTDTIHRHQQQQQQQEEVEGIPRKSSTLLNQASKIILDRRPVPYVGIPTPISIIHHESDKDTTPIHDRNNESYCSNGSSDKSRNDIDSIITIQKLLDGITILPHDPPQNSYSTSSMSILEQFQQEQHELQQKYQHQPPTFLLLLSHMYGNAYLHENHDIERAKLWFEYAKNQSKTNQEDVIIDPLDRYEANNQRRPTQQQQKKNEKIRHLSTDGNIRKHPDNRLQQSLYRIERLQRWYYEENPDIDENLLFEL